MAPRLVPRALALLTTASLFSGCFEAQSCNLVYAPEGVEITFTGDPLEDGTHTVEVAGLSCSFSIGDGGADTGTGGSGGCDAYTESAALLVTVLDDGPRVLRAILTEQAPASVDVVVLQGDEVRLSETLSPDYTVDEPNGEGCGERAFATEELALD